MIVEVFIKCANKYIVIPEKWIYDVNLESLETYGVNSNRNMLIFWSKNFQEEPNFAMEKSSDFPSANDRACYLARMIRYFGKYN